MNKVTRSIHISINGQEVVNSLTGIRGAIRNTERDIRNLNRNDKDYQETLRQHQQRLAALREEYTRARSELSQTPSILQRIKGELGDVATGMLKAFTVTALIGTFITGVRAAFQTIVDFDQAQADLAAILETNRISIRALTFDAMKLGATTSFTATQVSQAQLELAKLGKSIDEIRNMTPGVLNAAVAMDSELAPAAELVAGQLNSFGVASSKAKQYADVLSNSTNVSATSFDYLSTALPKTSKVAAVANVSFEQLNATMGVLADETIAAETAGTGFRNILLTASKEGVPYEQLLQKVKNSQNQLNEATNLFGKENATVAVILANSTEKIAQQTLALENSSGSAERLAKEKLNSLQGDMKLYDSAMEGFVLGMENGDGAIVKLSRSLVQFGTNLLSVLTPMRKVSDELFDQQMEVNELVSRITSSNIADAERLKLLRDLATNYPDLISQIDIETISNDELIKRLREVNKNYKERIALQLEVEKADKLREVRDSVVKDSAEWESRLRKRLQKVINENNFDDLRVDSGNIEKSAKEVMDRLKKEGKRTGWFSDYSKIENSLNAIKDLNKYEEIHTKQLNEQLDTIDEISKAKNIQTQADMDASDQAKKDLDELTAKATKMGGKAGKDFKADEIESIQKYIVTRQAEIDKDMYASTKKKENSDKEQKRLQRDADNKTKIFEAGEKAIDELLVQSINNREVALLKGIDRDVKSIELKYAKEIEKFKDHTSRIKELEIARDEEIAQIKLLKSQEYQEQIKALEDEAIIRKRENELQRYADGLIDEEERSLALLEKTREISDMELELQMDKEIAKVENVENSEALIAAIKRKYANQREGIEIGLADKERQISEAKVKKEKELQDQKLGVIKGAFNTASEMFNQGSGAWKATKIAETTIDTYQAASKALAAYPPPFSYIAMGVSIAAGLKNVQKIVSTKVPEMPTYYYGGFTSGTPQNLGGDKYGEFTGMTHANEWVMPAIMTQSPRYADTLTWLENERKYGPTSKAPGGDNEALIQASILLASATRELNENLANGLRANVNIGYKETMKINDLNKEITQSQNNSGI
ncbi:phage tail tape measure protein, TP901 family, core region [Myroides odoratimimus CCUG 12901]|uniref:phage tail tape measure protein n=1 Tax=Myroides odoratimimus TaxID=76832 RepID=UPI0002461157|nr:phage tail tape measure protein [Myroides odoratimimus]EHO05413.1 phage tail tape measure protein, TP901 family, core region [Myroides odoratimimus CCUG 12901]